MSPTQNTDLPRVLATLNAVHFRGLRLANLRCLVAASVLVWVHATGPRIPGLAWAGFLIEAGLLVMVATYAVEEQIWSRRATSLPSGSASASIHVVRTWRDELRSGLWYGAGVSSLLPWISAGVGRPLPPSLVLPLTGLYALLVTSAVAIEALARPGTGLRKSLAQRQWPVATNSPQRPGL